MAVLYSIRDWEKHFEIAQSKRAASLVWVPLPNKHDGKSYRRLLRMEHGLALFGGWVLIVQVASKCPTRGTLADADGPLTASDIADKTGASPEWIQRALDACSDPAIGWIAKAEQRNNRCKSRSTAINRDAPTGQDKTGEEKTGQDISCPEPASPASEPSATIAGSLLDFPCVGTGLKAWGLMPAKLAEYSATFPGIDVLAECRKARQWLLDNSSRQKTHAGMPRFIGSWLGRAQDGNAKGTANGRGQSLSGLQEFVERHRQ